MFWIQSQRIVNTAYTTSPENISVCYNGTRRTVSEEKIPELIKLCMELKPLSDEEQEKHRETAGYGYTGSDGTTIWFPRVNGHSYLIYVRMTDEAIYICRAHGVNSYVFYSDNGLRDFVSKLSSEG